MRPLLAILFSLAITLPAGAARADETVRVVSWNVWGVPYVTPDIDARLAAVADAVAPLQPDVLALQEVWEPEHGDMLRAELAEIGLVHAIHWIGDERQAGLFVASRWPIEEIAFERFRMGGFPLVPWHVDYLADKGVALVRVHAPTRAFVLADTHLQAAYGAFEYTPIRLGQMLQLAAILDRVEEPLVVAGDLNTTNDELGFRALVARAGLVDAAPGFGIDALLHRGGFTTLSHRRALDHEVALGDVSMRLSDHDALVVELAMTSAAVASSGWERVRGEVQAFVHARARDAAQLGGAHRLFGLALLALVIARWRRSTRRHSLRVAALTAFTLLYLGFAYGPHERDSLDRLLRETNARTVESAPRTSANAGSTVTLASR